MASYDIEANRRLAIWKQKMMMMKPLVYALIVEDKAKKRGLSVESFAAGDLNAIIGMPCMKNDVVERWCTEFEEWLRLAEKLVHVHFVL